MITVKCVSRRGKEGKFIKICLFLEDTEGPVIMNLMNIFRLDNSNEPSNRISSFPCSCKNYYKSVQIAERGNF